MGFPAGFNAVENEQISVAVVSDPTVGSDQHGCGFEEKLDRCVLCGGPCLTQCGKQPADLLRHTQETREHLRPTQAAR